METYSIRELSRLAKEADIQANVAAQITLLLEKTTKTNKPYLEIQISDAEDQRSLKIWGDSNAYAALQHENAGGFWLLSGLWKINDYGLNVDDLELSKLDPLAIEQLLCGNPLKAEQQARDLIYIRESINSWHDPRLIALAAGFLEKFEPLLLRTAAARTYHHARRGGLIEHVAQMMRCADSITPHYPELNRDLLLCGVLFHDCGKLWENRYQARGFDMPYQLHGEMLGHIGIGIELVNNLWREFELDEIPCSEQAAPSSDLRLHLIHLIASHHGELAFGSPVVPKTPEAAALHYVDNLDAKMEMFREAYAKAPALNEQIFERHRPLPGNLVRPLCHYPIANPPHDS